MTNSKWVNNRYLRSADISVRVLLSLIVIIQNLTMDRGVIKYAEIINLFFKI